MASVASIAIAPVKGLAVAQPAEVVLERAGVRANRRFHLVGEDGRLVNGKTASGLVQLTARADDDGTWLSIRCPDGTVAEADVELGAPVVTDFYGRPVAGHLVEGRFSVALSAFAGRPLRLVRVDEPGEGCDRGRDASVSLVSTAALAALARQTGVENVDGRRFRMLFDLAGLRANEEDTWVGRRVAVGDAVVHVRALVGRCAVTSKNPDTGARDLDTLRAIRRYRPDVEGEEPLPMGVWGSVEQPGRVRLGDEVAPL